MTDLSDAEMQPESAQLEQAADRERGRRPVISPFRPLKPRQAPKTDRPSLDWVQQRDLIQKLIELGRLTEKQVAPLIEASMKASQPSTAIILGEAVEGLFSPSYRVLNNVGRSYIQIGEFDKAINSLVRLRELEPSRHGAVFYLGVAYARRQRFVEAYETFLHCISTQPSLFKYHFEAARTAVLIRFGGYGVFQERPEFLETSLKPFRSRL